jgi:hypothetical protein
MISTPETDAAIKTQAQWRRPFISYTMDGITWDGPVADLCRKLERERAGARKEIENIRKILSESGEAVGNGEHDYSIIDMIENLIKSKDYFVRKSDSLERERDEARAELKEKQEIIHRSCVDWAEDHTYLQNLCREAGGTEQEIEGDSYGVPGIIDLANYLKQLLIKQQDATQNTVKLNEEHLCAFHGDMLGNCLVCQLEEIK